MYEASAKYDIKMNPVVLKFSIEVPGLAKVEVPFNLSDSHPIASGSWVYGPFENYIDVGGSISITGTGTLSVSAGVDFTGQEYSRNHVQYFKGTAVAGAWFRGGWPCCCGLGNGDAAEPAPTKQGLVPERGP